MSDRRKRWNPGPRDAFRSAPKRWFEVHCPHMDAYLAPWHREWWRQCWWRFFSQPFYRLCIWPGFYELDEGRCYAEGVWSWRLPREHQIGPAAHPWGQAPYGALIRYCRPGLRGYWRYVTNQWP